MFVMLSSIGGLWKVVTGVFTAIIAPKLLAKFYSKMASDIGKENGTE